MTDDEPIRLRVPETPEEWAATIQFHKVAARIMARLDAKDALAARMALETPPPPGSMAAIGSVMKEVAR